MATITAPGYRDSNNAGFGANTSAVKMRLPSIVIVAWTVRGTRGTGSTDGSTAGPAGNIEYNANNVWSTMRDFLQ